MKQKWRAGMVMVVAMAMSGCNMVMTERPAFTAADGAGAPPIRPGVWRNLKPGCVVDETLPRSQWPKCALPALTVSDHPTWTEVTGDPDILQAKLPFHIGAKDKTSAPYVYLAFRPLKLDAQGRVVAMKQWFVRCGPPPVSTSTAPANPSPSLPPSAPATSGQASPAGNSSDAAPANMREAIARLADASTKLARVAPTTAPLPGLTMNDSGGCTSDSAAAIRNAAKPSEAWVATTPSTFSGCARSVQTIRRPVHPATWRRITANTMTSRPSNCRKILPTAISQQ